MTETVSLRRLGSTNVQISALGLGCWQFSKGKGLIGRFWPVLSDEDISRIVRVSYEGGINWFDTAEIYGNGASERALDKALTELSPRPDSFYIATKWWPLFRTAASLRSTIDSRIEALGGRPITLYQIHQPYSFSGIQELMKAMSQLQKDGKIRYAGVSNYSAKQMREAHRHLKDYGFELVSNQVKYSMLDRRAETNGVMEAAQELGMTVIAYSPLEQGLLTGKFHENPALISGPRKWYPAFRSEGLKKSQELIRELRRLAELYQCTTSQIALNWLIHAHGDTVVAIPGASKVKHAEENVGALKFKLTPEELRNLDQLSRKSGARL